MGSWCKGPSPRVAGAAEVEERQGPKAAFAHIPDMEDALISGSSGSRTRSERGRGEQEKQQESGLCCSALPGWGVGGRSYVVNGVGGEGGAVAARMRTGNAQTCKGVSVTMWVPGWPR